MRIRLDSVSMGKGFVEYHVHYPPVSKKKRGLERRFDNLEVACRELKAHCTRDELEPETVALVEKYAPDGNWAEVAGA